MELSQQSLILLADMLHCATMEEHEVEDLGTLTDVFIPLS